MANLGMLPGDASSVAFGINNHGQVVGTSCSGILATGNCRAYIWQDGVMTDLNTLVKSGSTSFPLLFANQINDHGEIAGIAAFAYDPTQGEGRAFLAIPCDEEHADNEGCEAGAEGTSTARAETSQNLKFVVPENVRKLVRQRLGIGRFGAPR
jgi:probable HAF family extracellular repeat protein